ncbi:hypothetical protein [Subtercola endophyticus]|uniref:hypothetical protein n=1 Tax=Subtercola endophyticus TaxID=2895559 RepID=UPI001E4A2C3E|nr:hypothetical protein [Subtercola endophyticus]UFS58574.1 hypothetical protein LQ955_16460 [Subtercola endophyticus]
MSEDLVRRFENPDLSYGPVPLWWWSGEKLDSTRLRWQMQQLVDQNVRQAVVMNLAPTGPLYGALADDPAFMSDEWWTIFERACVDADELGFQIWLYDQIGFSGANIQGHLVAADPTLAGQALGQVRIDVSGDVSLAAPEGSVALGAWYIAPGSATSTPVTLRGNGATYAADGGELVVAFVATRGFDYFSRKASAALIDAVFGAYSRHVGQWFGTAIGGVFQDELPDMPSWSSTFAAEFEAANAYSVLELLPALWGDPLFEGATRDAGTVRVDYHRTRARLGEEAFFTPLAEWLKGAGLECGFDQQTPAREGDPAGATRLYGDYLATHSQYGIPGSDHWGDSKIHSSMAHANGHERVWIESFHSSGWGGTLEETYDWLSPYFRRGANLYDPHAVYYSTRSGWFEWAPPSTCWRQPYWPAYGEFALAIARVSSTLTMGQHRASTVLFYPTESAQFDVTVDGRDLGEARSTAHYHQLNGATSWFAERRGLLESAGVDYDILGSDTVAHAAIEADAAGGAELLIGSGRFRNVVLPDVRVLSVATARVLLDFAAAGGVIVASGETPSVFTNGDAASTAAVTLGFAAALSAGSIAVVADTAEVAGALADSVVTVRADAPTMLRSVGDAHLIALIAHDEETGTVQPLLPGFEDSAWIEGGGSFNWKVYWHDLSTKGYTFVPPTGRTFTATVSGLGAGDLTVQQWDARTGKRYAVPFTRSAGEITVTSEFSSGSVEFLVIAPELPEPTGKRTGDVLDTLALDGAWRVQAESTLDNQWGDVGPVAETGVIPVQVWEFIHETDEPGAVSGQKVTATFGPFADVAGPIDAAGAAGAAGAAPEWKPAVWSLSRGIQNDVIHDESLGPNGYVPEEFVSFPDTTAGEVYRLRTTIAVPEGPALTLVVGSNAVRRVLLDGLEAPVVGAGYLSHTPVSPNDSLELEIELTSVVDGTVRLSFALTSDTEAYQRPEWIVATDPFSRSTGVSFETTFEVDAQALAEGGLDTRIQVSSEAPTIILVNGVEVGRQGDFDPYSVKRFTRVHPYDLATVLRGGLNSIVVNCVDVGRPVAIRVDSVPAADAGLGLATTLDWAMTREGLPAPFGLRLAQYEDPRYGCIVPRPHPLQAATWLETEAASSTVVPLVPDARAAAGRTERLTFDVPVGATRVTVPTVVPFEVAATSVAASTASSVERSGNTLVFSAPAEPGTELTLVFAPADGRRGGALLDAALTVETAEATADLVPWHELGLGSLGGAVHYRRTVDWKPGAADARAVLDLGIVRGTASVSVDGELVQTLFAAPFTVDLTDALSAEATHDVTVTVRGTLAPYMQYASPTSAVMAGQTVHGLFGPVVLQTHGVAVTAGS